MSAEFSLVKNQELTQSASKQVIISESQRKGETAKVDVPSTDYGLMLQKVIAVCVTHFAEKQSITCIITQYAEDPNAKFPISKRPDPEAVVIVHNLSEFGGFETVSLRLRELAEMNKQAGFLDSVSNQRHIETTETELVSVPSGVEIQWC
ncbi:MAG TPA: hypothetical protein VLG44_00730 [Chlamydiales bacterium]|nr:hypothetical protein [Chlamydiales bacterium]